MTDITEADISQLPDEVQAAITGPEKVTKTMLENLRIKLTALRDKAVAGRKASGIEEVWTAAEEAYLGIDDANRATMGGVRWSKPQSMEGPVTTNRVPQQGEIKSDAFVRLSSRYVDAGTAKLTEILLPIDDKAFSFTSTPLPEMAKGLKDNRQLLYQGQPLTRDATPQEAQALPGAAPAQPGVAAPPPAAPAPGTPAPQVPLTVKDQVEEQIAAAQEAARRAERRIYDWMVEARYRGEARKVIFDMGKLGVGVLKGPFPEERTRKRAKRSDSGKSTLVLETSVKPGYRWLSPWNFYPDPDCGENPREGSHVFEVDFFSKAQVRKLRGQAGYINSAIDQVLAETPQASKVDSSSRTSGGRVKESDGRYPVWYFYGMLPREMLEATGVVDESAMIGPHVYAIVTIINDTVVHAVINPLTSGEFPYHAVPWQRRVGHWAGVGICEQLDMPQRLINAATRALSNNAGRSAGSIIVINRGAIVPADGNWTLTPDKIFFMTGESSPDDVAKAVKTFQIPNVGAQLMAIIEYAFRLAEESTSIPLVTQGQSGPTTPDTYGATQLQNNNANQLLRSIGYAFDDFLTEPVVLQSYEWLLLDDAVPEDEKGDWTINAHGSAALVERAIQDQAIQQMGEWVLNPVFGVDPKRWLKQYMLSKKFRPSDFQYTEEEQAKIDSQPPVPAPAVQVAQIRSQDAQARIKAEQADAEAQRALTQAIADRAAQTKENAAAMKKATDELRIRSDTDRDTAYVEAQNRSADIDANARREELALKREIAMLQYATQKEISLDQVKAELAGKQMTLEVQERMAAKEKAATATPVAEPAGKAAPGNSFTE